MARDFNPRNPEGHRSGDESPAAGASVPVPITRPSPALHEATPAPPPPDRPDAPSLASEQPVEERFIFTPPIDIYETSEGLVLEADLPGVTSETLELQVQNNKLTLFGRVVKQAPEDAIPRHEEYGVGDYLRSFILSDEVDYDRISAKLQNGVLRVVLPKAAKSAPRRIEISTQ